MMNNSRKRNYQPPYIEVTAIDSGNFMVEIGSGNTTPEESDTNGTFFDMEDEDMTPKSHSLWDE